MFFSETRCTYATDMPRRFAGGQLRIAVDYVEP